MSAFAYALDDDGVAVVVFDDPARSVNVWSRDALDDLERVLVELTERPELAAVVFRSGKPDTFVAGADIEMLARVASAGEARALSERGQAAFQRVADLSVPTVAAIHGACVGGGLEFALACSFRVASDDDATKLGFPEVQLGILPAWGGSQRAPRLVGLQAALGLILTGDRASARRARRMHLVDRVVPAAGLAAAAREVALQAARGRGAPSPGTGVARLLLEGNPLGRRVILSQARKRVLDRTQGHYPAPLAALDVIEVGLSGGLEAGLRAEADAVARLFTGAVARNLLRLYLQREAVRETPGAGQPRRVRRLGVLGAGVMGGGIAEVAAYRGVEVRMKDVALERVAQGLAHAARIAGKGRKKGVLSDLEARDLLHRISGTVEYSGFARADLVIEAVVEDANVKKSVLEEAERAAPGAVFATNTSSLRVDDLSRALSDPSAFGGLHFFNPVERMPLVEVVRGARTSDDALATLHAFAVRLGKVPIVVRDGPGFWVNRLLMPYLSEAAHLWAEGIPVEELDGALEEFGLPMGPLALLDEVGLDVAAKVGVVLERAFPDRMRPHPLLQRLVSEGRLGKKGGRGFYLYQDGERKGPDGRLRDALGVGGRDRGAARSGTGHEAPVYDDPYLVARCLYPMVNEAARALEERIVASADDGDLALVMGMGWPPFRGGLLRWADEVGIAIIVQRLEEWAGALGPRFAPAEALRARRREGFYGLTAPAEAQPRLEGL